MRGGCTLLHWCKKQHAIALISWGSGFYAAVKCGHVAISTRNTLRDLKQSAYIEMWTDNSALVDQPHKTGLGAGKHVALRYLWLQQQVGAKGIALQWVETSENPADVFTKALAISRIIYLLGLLGMMYGDVNGALW